MPSDLLKFLYDESQRDAESDLKLSLDEDVVHLLEAAENEEKLAVKAEPLLKVLKSVLDLADDQLSLYTDGVKLTVDDQDKYMYYRQKLTHPDVVAKLAELGWVIFFGGDKNSAFEPPAYQLKFLALSTADTDPAAISKEIGDGKDQKKWDDYMRKAGERSLGVREPDPELSYGPEDIPDPKKA